MRWAIIETSCGERTRRGSPEEVEALEALYRHDFCPRALRGEHGGARPYTWVRSRLQEAGLVRTGRGRGFGTSRRR